MSRINSNTLFLTRCNDNAYYRANIKYGRSPGMSLLGSYRAGLLFTLLAAVSPAQDYRGRIQGTVRDTSDAVIAGASCHAAQREHRYLQQPGEPTRQAITFSTWWNRALTVSPWRIPDSRSSCRRTVPLACARRYHGGCHAEDRRHARKPSRSPPRQARFSSPPANWKRPSIRSSPEQLPQLYRSPFVLATLDPSVLKDDANTEYNPFNSWGPGRMSVGGGANFSNDLQVDGSRVGISVKTGYVPTPDMVQEVNVSQNTVDAEFGHGSGSAISIVTKGGNEPVPRKCVLLWPLSLGCRSLEPAVSYRQPGSPADVRRHSRPSYPEEQAIQLCLV